MNLESMYQEIILDHYKNPHGRGLREPFDAESFQVNPTCGDEVTLRVAVAEKLEDSLEDAVAFAGVSKYPARIKCALMSWMALKDASARALSTQAPVVTHPATPTGGTA